jgi:hypothetical protein
MLLTYRSKENSACLFELMEVQNAIMRACINGVDLLIFTSKQLHVDSQSELSGFQRISFSCGFPMFFFTVASAFPIHEHNQVQLFRVFFLGGEGGGVGGGGLEIILNLGLSTNLLVHVFKD